MIKLTIGIPSLPSRSRKYLEPLIAKLQNQIGDAKDIEIISLIDNKAMTVGRKRSILFNIAQGKYVCQIDDDDDITDDFVDTLRDTIKEDTDVDVICYNQEANMNGRIWIVETSLSNNQVHPFDQMQVDKNGESVPCKRPPWHWCAWKTSLVKNIPFGNSNTQEDTVFVIEAIKAAKTQIVIPKVLCKYRWFPNVSQAQFQNINPSDVSKVIL